ncbi:hypothetical protein [Streptomyces sp. NPDC015680]|uniref:hypothetical protein n=1 Tax=Streptomyces sp. NPDC015680 TaxID=3364962 RepID=UPI0036F53C9C
MNEIEEFEQGRRAPFTMLGDWVAVSGVDPNARSVYWDIKAHVNENRGTGTAWPPRDFLAMLAGDKQARTMDPYLRQLEAIDAIGAERERQIAKMRSRNLYKIHDTPPRGWDGPASHAEVWEWLREDETGCRQYYVDRKAWLKDIENAWSRIKKGEKDRGAKPSAPVSKAGHRAWLKECHGLWVARRKGHASSPRSAVQRTTEISGKDGSREDGSTESDQRDSGSAVQRTTQCGTAHLGSAVQRTGTTSKGNKKEEKNEAASPRSGGDGRRPSDRSKRAREEGGFAASDKTSPSPAPNNDTDRPTRGQKSGGKKAAHTREQLDIVRRVRALFPRELLDAAGGLPDVPTLSSVILTAMSEGRTVEQMGERIWYRWSNHGFADQWAELGRFEKPVGVAVALVRPLRRGDRFACPDLRCENGASLDTGAPCRLCEERIADWKAEQARKYSQKPPSGVNSTPAAPGSPSLTMPPQRASQPRPEPRTEDDWRQQAAAAEKALIDSECSGRDNMCGRMLAPGKTLCRDCAEDAAEQYTLENAGAPAPF